MNQPNTINYIEFATNDIDATKRFFTSVFGWSFQDYGPDYAAFSDAGIEGGFFRGEATSQTASGGALVVLYSDTLESVEAEVQRAGGTLSKPIFTFPGGRRFHFIEPGGNELAVWTERNV